MSKSLPDNKKLYEQVKQEADKIYKVPSAYKSGWIVKTYKERGGTYSGTNNVKPLARWFDEKWVNLNKKRPDGTYEPCGRKSTKDSQGKYPLCRPSIRITSSTPTTIKELSEKRIKDAKVKKEKIKDHGKIRF
jgi:hypothetical protein